MKAYNFHCYTIVIISRICLYFFAFFFEENENYVCKTIIIYVEKLEFSLSVKFFNRKEQYSFTFCLKNNEIMHCVVQVYVYLCVVYLCVFRMFLV